MGHNPNRWSVAEAKQKLAAVLRAAANEPQLIFSRSRLVGAVVDPTTLEAFETWKQDAGRRSLGATFAELRRLCEEESYSFELGERVDREDRFSPALSDASG